MEKYIIEGTKEICGEVSISGSKNSALPIIAAALLIDGETKLLNIPNLFDINLLLDILKNFGAKCSFEKNKVIVDAKNITNLSAPYELTSKIRGSFLVVGPMLVRFGRIKISYPGGCQIGLRPIDLHLKGLSLLGAKITQGQGYIDIRSKKLRGAKIYLDFPSVGATENIMMAAVLADGVTQIQNASLEPEIVDLANFLNKAGAKISGAGTDEIVITGVTKLSSVSYKIIPDRIEAGTFMTLSAITSCPVKLKNICVSHLSPINAKLLEMGLSISIDKNELSVLSPEKLKPTNIKTMPHPGFPTDMQAPFTALLSTCEGTSIISETIFENRFLHVPELCRMGAQISTEGRTCVIEGKKQLLGAPVTAKDLRAGAALVLAAISAKGKSEISDIYHIERGYDSLDEKLRNIGVKITKKSI